MCRVCAERLMHTFMKGASAMKRFIFLVKKIAQISLFVVLNYDETERKRWVGSILFFFFFFCIYFFYYYYFVCVCILFIFVLSITATLSVVELSFFLSPSIPLRVFCFSFSVLLCCSVSPKIHTRRAPKTTQSEEEGAAKREHTTWLFWQYNSIQFSKKTYTKFTLILLSLADVFFFFKFYF